MLNKLEFDERNDMEQKFQIGNDYGSILWDVEAILKNCSSFPIVEYPTEDLVKAYPFHGDADYAMKTDTTSPGIIVELSDDLEILIDGNHLLFKANKTGQILFRCYYLQEHEQKRFIVDYDSEIYSVIIDHWHR